MGDARIKLNEPYKMYCMHQNIIISGFGSKMNDNFLIFVILDSSVRKYKSSISQDRNQIA